MTNEEAVVADKTQSFKGLRGVQWRIDLGVLPHSATSSIDNLRRVTADSRRRYASLRRRHLVDPHISKDGRSSLDLVVDNPLSQNPDSMWGRFFRNAELEKMVDQDLLRLYPEDGSYFQTTGCQGMLRRILLLWCLSHPEYGYRQGMHELLAPLVYVLHVDIERLSQVRKLYEAHFTDKFDELSVYEDDQTYTFDYRRFSDTMEDDSVCHEKAVKAKSLNELDPEVQKIILLSDAYGAEGELGIVLSEKFMEHDAYSMFDALMSGVNGSVAMADFFSHSPAGGCKANLSPVIEASAGLYHLLSVVDSSLHCHLIELGVEPQYFALRWLRVLFGREFALQDLFLIWDEIFAQDNCKSDINGEDDGFEIFGSSRGAFIAAVAVSMILYLRSSLLAAETSTSCLQKLLNFPQNIDLCKLIEKAKSLQICALDVNNTHKAPQTGGTIQRGKPAAVRGHSLSSDFISPTTPTSLVPDSYWEEMWRVLHKEEEHKKDTSAKEASNKKRSWSEKVRLRLSRTESDPSSTKVETGKRSMRSSIRRSLLEDLSQQLGDDEIPEEISCPKTPDHKSVEGMAEEQKVHNDSSSSTDDEERRISGNGTSEENSSVFSDPPASPLNSADHENDSEKNSFVSNSSIDEEDNHQTITGEDSSLPVSDVPESTPIESVSKNDTTKKNWSGMKERKGKFQWLWSFGRNAANEEKHDIKDDFPETSQSITNGRDDYSDETRSAAVDGSSELPVSSKGDAVDSNVIGPLKNLGQTMLEHIQVIESAFQQERGQVGSLESFSKNVLVGKGQVTAMAALKELRKISNLLSEM